MVTKTFPYNAVGKAQAHSFAKMMKGKKKITQATAWRKSLTKMDELDIDNLKKKKFNISIENLITIGMVVVTITGMWYSLQGEIEEAKKLPEPEVSRTEYDLKDQLIRETIISTEEKVDANSEKLDKIDEKLYEIIIKE